MYALTTHSISVNVAPSDRAIDGSDTATMFASSMINDETSEAVSRTENFLRPSAVGVRRCVCVIRGASSCASVAGAPLGAQAPYPPQALVGFQGRGFADGIPPDFGHALFLETLIFQ